MHDLTTGSVTRHLLKTTSFMLVTMLFQTLYFLVDLYWVGRLGKEAVAGVGLAGNFTFLVFAVSQMLGVGTMVLVSHAAGRKDHERALLVFNQSQTLALVVAVVFLIVGMAGRVAFARAMAADATTAARAQEYLLWFVPALALQFGIVTMGSALRGVGDFKPGMIVQSVTVILNMVLAPFLIFGWVTHRPMGVAGAALATFVSLVVGTLWLITYFLPHGAFLKFSRRDWKPRPDVWKSMLQVGLPAGTEFALMAVYLFLVYQISRPFGAAAQAGFGIGLRVVQSMFMPVVALGFSVGPVAGQNFGARLAERVRETLRSALAMSAGCMAVLAVVCHAAAEPLVRIFSDDPHVVAVGVEYLRIIVWNFVPSGVIFVASSMFQALGNTMPALIASGIRIGLVTIPAVLMSRVPGFELRWLWILSVSAIALQMVLSLVLLQRELRLKLDGMPAAVPAPAAG